MRTISGKCARGHAVQVNIDADGDVRGTIGTQDVDPSADPDWDDENPIVVACDDCVAELERIATEAGALRT